MHIKANSLQDAIAQAGFEPPAHIFTGKLERFPTDPAKPKSRDGWYVSLDGDSAVFSSWRDADARYTWSRNGKEIDGDTHERMERIRSERLEEEKANKEEAAERAQAIYTKAMAEAGDYRPAYLEKKGIDLPVGTAPFSDVPSSYFGFKGRRLMSGLLSPLFDAAGDLRSLQIITEDKKLFMKDGQTYGCFHQLGEVRDKLMVCEGLATGQSALQATGIPVFVAYSAGNLPGVAKIARKRHPDAKILILADDDPAGREKAQIAANRTHANVLVASGGCNDVNDMHAEHGLERVADLIREQLPDASWKDDLIVHQGKDESWYPSHVHNLQLILANAFPHKLELDEFSGQRIIDGEEFDEGALTGAQAWLEKNWMSKLGVKVSALESAITAVSGRNGYHPVRRYLDSLRWDGRERIPRFFLEACGCEPDEYHMAVAISLFVSAVARIYKPGCKVDTMVILQGPQGWGKTGTWAELFGQWCSEVTSSLHDKDFFQGLHGRWCADFGELDQFTRAESTRIKQILTQTHDHYRPPYGRMFVNLPRQCVFVGGTNEQHWQRDSTGGRRFLPVVMERKIDLAWVRTHRDQLWAEAMVRYGRGETWWDIPGAEERQEAIQHVDPWEGIIADYLQGIVGETTMDDLLSAALLIEKGKRSALDAMRVGKILATLGWSRKRARREGKRVYIYVLERGVPPLYPPSRVNPY